MKEAYQKLINQEVLSRVEAQSLMVGIADGVFVNSELAAILTNYKLRSVSVNELLGFRETILNYALAPKLVSDLELFDVCGTGGDGKDTFNISTLTSLVLAELGIKVAKHGNSSFSSICGSSNVLENIGINLATSEENLDRSLQECNICFLHAPLYHPALKNVSTVRRELGFRTIFNLLGPLVNPLRPKAQIAGVANLETLRLYQQVLAEINNDYAVLYSYDGYDEISLTGKFIVVSNKFNLEIWPEELGLKSVTPESLSAGDSVSSATKIFKRIISGHGTLEQKSVVAINAAVAIKLASPEVSWSVAYQQALDVLTSGRLLVLVNNLIKITNEN